MAGLHLMLLLLLDLLVAGTEASRQISKLLREELEVGSHVTDVKRDARLGDVFNQSTLAALRFSFLTGPNNDAQHYFDLDKVTGTVRTLLPIDRDRICPGAVRCLLQCDVAVEPPFFQVVKLSVEITDENDNAPRFPAASVKTSVSESTQPGPFYPIQLADDPDSPRNGVVRYVLQPSNEKFGLAVTKSSDDTIQDVQLVLRESLDREHRDSYKVKVVAYDNGSPAKSGAVLIDVQVTDENDHRPEFDRTSYDLEVTENSPPKRPLLAVRATDSDAGPNGAVTYRFSAKTATQFGHLFTIDRDSGQVSMLRPLDYEDHPSMTLEVLAQDQGQGSSPVKTRVVITVRDLNDNVPKITIDESYLRDPETEVDGGKLYSHVTENCANGTYVIQFSVEDGDNGDAGKVGCHLRETGKSRHFRLDQPYEKEFAVVTNATLDRETDDRHELVVTCIDNGQPPLTSTVSIVIVVDDVNDNPPKFLQMDYDFKVKENIATLEEIRTISATDPDGGSNGTVSYSIGSSDPDSRDTFHIDKTSGLIWAKKSLDRERKDAYSFHVIATDGLPGQVDARSSVVMVTLRVADVNDESPRFNQSKYNFSVHENQPVRTAVGQVSAYDPDLPPGNRFTYQLDPTTCPTHLFRIDASTGMIATRTGLNREDRKSYEFKVTARDEEQLPGASAPGFATVFVHVIDENDNPPTIYFPGIGNDTVYISNSVPIGHPVTSVIARDPDDGDNARLTYIISGGNEQGAFGIDPLTGDLFVSSLLAEFEMATFRLLLIVQDAGNPKKIRNATLQIVVSAASHLHSSSSSGGSGGGGSFRLSFTDTHLAMIVGIVGGCLVIALAMVIAACFVRRRRRRRRHKTGKGPRGAAGDLGPGGASSSSGTLANVKYVPAANGVGGGGLQDDHSIGTGSCPSYMRDSIGLPEDLAPEDGYVIVNCTHPGDSVTAQMAFDRRSRLYSPKPDLNKCQQCDEAMSQLQMCSRAPAPLYTSTDFARFQASQQRPIFAPVDYAPVIFSESLTSGPITSPEWTTSQQRKPSFSQWLNSESFHLKQRGQAYNVADYGTLGRANGAAAQRHPNGDVGSGGMTLVDPQRSVMMTTCHDGTIRATPASVSRQLGFLGKHLSNPSPPTIMSSQAIGVEAPHHPIKNHTTTNPAALAS